MDVNKEAIDLNKGRSWYYVFFAGIVVLICIFPIYGALIDQDYQLKGVASSGGSVPKDVRSLWTGITQNAWENEMKETVPGHTSLIRFHSQFLYSLFNSSSNSNVVIGGNHSLYEPEYLCDFLNLWPEMSEEAQNELIGKLNQLQDLLTQKEKKLYIFITPSKVRYDYPNIPWFYRALTKPNVHTNYDNFIRRLSATSINYFDSIEYINENMPDSTIFYSSGIHWGNAAAAQVTAAMLEDMGSDTGYDLGDLSVSLVDSDNGMAPDQDLLSILNLYFYPNEDVYRVPEFNYTPGKNHPNVLMRGGSFMGQTLSKLIDMDVFANNIFFQNNFVILNKSDIRTLSDFNSYDEIDVAAMVDNSELVILEVNEEKIWIMSWGFIDELIDVLQNESDETVVHLIGQKNISTDENPWGMNIGYIDYYEKKGILLTSPLDAEIQIKIPNSGSKNNLSFDAAIHDLVRQYSDGCTLLVKIEGEKTMESEYLIPGGMEENATVHVQLPMQDIRQVSISYYNPEGTSADCDWIVISNMNMQ